MKKFIFTILFFSCILSVNAQDSYARTYGEVGDDNAYAIAMDEINEQLLVGVTSSFSSAKGVFVIKVDSVGGLIWSRVISFEKNIIARQVKRVPNNGWIICGTIEGVGAGMKDAVIIKLRDNGEVEWSKVYGGESHDYAFDILATLDGGFLFVGETNSFDVSSSDLFVVKLYADGRVDWAKTFGGANVDYAYSVVETLDGYVVASETNTHGAGGWDVALTKINKEGDLTWYTVFGGPKDDFGYSIDIDPRTLDVFMTGSTSSFGMGGRDIYLFQVNKSGSLKSARTFGDTYDEQGHVVKVMYDGGIAIAGFTNSFHGHLNAEDALLIRLSSNLHLKWSKVFGGVFGDYALGLAVDSSHHIYMTGETFSYNGKSDKDAYLVKSTDNPGQSGCEQVRVQVTPLKVTEHVKVNKYDVIPKKVDAKVQRVELIDKEVLTLENIICNDNINLIDGGRRK